MAARVVIDTNTNCTPHIAALQKRGVTHVGRYYASGAWKRVTKAEAQALSDVAIQIFTVFEDSGDPKLTFDQGMHDAQIALGQAKGIGQPEGTAIYFALEHLPHGYATSDVPGIKRYVAGIKRVLGDSYRVGIYSDGVVLDELLDAKLIDYAWLSASSSFAGSKGFDKAKRWHLAQRKVDLDWNGVSVDTNDARDEFGAFLLGPSPATRVHKEAEVAIVSTTEAHEEAHTADVVSVHMVIPAADAPAAEKASYWQGWSFSQVNDLADQGSRLADHVRNFTAGIWKRRVVMGGGGGTAATAISNSDVAQSWIAAHPLLAVAMAVGVILLAYEIYDQVQAYRIRRGLLSAANDGRYVPRGAQQKA